MASQPINYLGGLGELVNPIDAVNKGIQDSLTIQGLQAKQQANETALARQAMKQNLVLQAKTPQDYARLAALFPEDQEAFKTAYQGVDKSQKDNDLLEMTAIRGYLAAGDPNAAVARLQRRIDADRAAGQDTTDDEGILASIQSNPEGAAKLIDYTIAGIAGPEKVGDVYKQFGDAYATEMKIPGEVAKTAAETSRITEEANTIAPLAQATIANTESQIADRLAQQSLGWERLALDKDQLATTTQLKLQELQQTGTKVEGKSLDALTDAVGNEQKGLSLANRARSLADQFEASDVRGAGARSGFGEFAAGWFGNQDAVTALRAQYSQLTNGIAMKNLPPGSASDKDVAIALRGFPPPTADKAYMVSWLRGLAKLQEAEANADGSKASWISENGSLGTAKRDLNVRGTRVPAGTTFGEFIKNGYAIQGAKELPQRSYLKYGSPSGNFVQQR